MSTEDPDFQQLRDFRSGLAEPSADRLARMRARVASAAEPAARPRRMIRGLVVPAIAGAAVLAIAIGATVVAFDGSGDSGTSDVVSTSVTPDDPYNTSSTAEPPAPAEHQAAVQLLEQLAARAVNGPAPLTVPAGQLLYVRSTGIEKTGSETVSQVGESWIDPNGAVPVMMRSANNGKQTLLAPDPNDPEDNYHEEIARQRAELATTGPSLTQPTPAYLAALPTDPAALLELLKSTSLPYRGDWSPDNGLLQFMLDLFHNNDPLLTPDVRAALYRALSKVDSISSTGQPVEVDGRTVYAIAQRERRDRKEFLIDARTGHFAGLRTYFDGSLVFQNLWTHAVVPTPGATP